MKRLSTLGLFILSCFDRGLETPYDLQRRAGLSLGATTPALKRLLKAGLLKKTEARTATKRPRHEYELTASGCEQAKTGWKAYIGDSAPPNDVDSFMRVYDMAMYYKAGATVLKSYLQRAADSRVHAAEVLKVENRRGSASGEFPYVGIRSRFELARLESEAEVIHKLIGDSTPKKRTRRVVSTGRR